MAEERVAVLLIQQALKCQIGLKQQKVLKPLVRVAVGVVEENPLPQVVEEEECPQSRLEEVVVVEAHLLMVTHVEAEKVIWQPLPSLPAAPASSEGGH